MNSFKKIRLKKVKPVLTEHQINFCKMIATGMTSIEAYTASHFEINKVRASTYLQSPWIWDNIILFYKKHDKEKHAVAAYDQCVKLTGKRPTNIFNDYFLDKNYKNPLDNNPFFTLRQQCLAYIFFECIDREYFLNKLAKSIDILYADCDGLAQIDEYKKIYFNNLKKEIASYGYIYEPNNFLNNGSTKG